MFVIKLTATLASGKRIGYVASSGDVVNHAFQAKTYTFKDQAQAIANAYSRKEQKVSARVVKAPESGGLKSFLAAFDAAKTSQP